MNIGGGNTKRIDAGMDEDIFMTVKHNNIITLKRNNIGTLVTSVQQKRYNTKDTQMIWTGKVRVTFRSWLSARCQNTNKND